MKHLTQTEPIIIDQNYLAEVYAKIVSKINILDQLRRQHKEKQEDHFLKTFMHVVDKMANQIRVAQQAYRNANVEAMKEDSYLQLVEQLNFCKRQCLKLKELFEQSQKSLNTIRVIKQNTEAELQLTKCHNLKKIKECLKLKAENNSVKIQMMTLKKEYQKRLFKQGQQISSDINEFKELSNRYLSSTAGELGHHNLSHKISSQHLSRNDKINISQTPINHKFSSPDYLQQRNAFSNSSFRNKCFYQRRKITSALQDYELPFD